MGSQFDPLAPLLLAPLLDAFELPTSPPQATTIAAATGAPAMTPLMILERAVV